MLIFGDFFSVHWGYIAFTDFSSSGKTKTKKSKLGQPLLKVFNSKNCKKRQDDHIVLYTRFVAPPPFIQIMLKTLSKAIFVS